MRKNITGLLWAVMVICWSNNAAAQLPSLKKTSGAEVFQQLASYVGEWKVAGNQNKDLGITFDMAANDTVLVETWKYKGKIHALTLYTLNRDQVVATHYCPHGNQPTLVLNASPKKNVIGFKFQSAAGLSDDDKAYLRQLTYETVDAAKLKRLEVYATPDGDKSSELLLERAGALPAESQTEGAPK